MQTCDSNEELISLVTVMLHWGYLYIGVLKIVEDLLWPIQYYVS